VKEVKILLKVIVVVTLLVIGLGCSAATPDFTVTSSIDNNHSHKVVIAGSDVDNPPAADKTITSDGASHTHTIKLTMQNYQAIKAGQQVTVTSSSNGPTPHTHTFAIKKP
jgi:hypothetical protein